MQDTTILCMYLIVLYVHTQIFHYPDVWYTKILKKQACE